MELRFRLVCRGEVLSSDEDRRKYTTVREVAEYLSILRSAAYDLARRYDSQGHMFSGAVRVSKYELAVSRRPTPCSGLQDR